MCHSGCLSPLLLCCRYATSTDTVSDPAFPNYHAVAALPRQALAALAAPGATSASFTVSLDTSFSKAAADLSHDGQLVSRLPPQPTPGAKAKPCEAALAPAEDGSVPCAWQGAAFQLQLELTTPIVPPWKPPPKLLKGLADIVPSRQADAQAPSETATNRFNSLVLGVSSATQLQLPAQCGPCVCCS